MADPIDLDAIEACAKAATQGEWRVGVRHPDGGHEILADEADGEPWPIARVYDEDESDAAHIAGLDPPAVLALVAEVRRLRAIEEAAKALLDVDDDTDTGARWYAAQEELEAALNPSHLDKFLRDPENARVFEEERVKALAEEGLCPTCRGKGGWDTYDTEAGGWPLGRWWQSCPDCGGTGRAPEGGGK